MVAMTVPEQDACVSSVPGLLMDTGCRFWV